MLKKYILKDMFLPYYHKWLLEREEILKESGQVTDNLFITKDGNPANADRLRDWIGAWSDIVGQTLYPHSLRHYQISLLKRLEIDDDLIVYLTGWAEGTGHTMISIYNDNEMKDAKFACLSNLKTALAENKI
jgi:integrase